MRFVVVHRGGYGPLKWARIESSRAASTFRWAGEEWEARRESPIITHPHFTGTGTRTLQPNAKQAIDELFTRSFSAAS